MNKLYAFWKYDIFPKICGGQVTQIDEEGNVEIKEYGKNSWFQPDKIVSLTEGKKIAARLADLENRYIEEKEVLDKKFLKERDSIIKL